MQDRYAGDIGDFGKIGLLKALQAQGLSVGVNWYHVEPMDIEKKADGTVVELDNGHFGLIAAHSTGIAFNSWDKNYFNPNIWFPEYPTLKFTDEFLSDDFEKWRTYSFRKLLLQVNSDSEFDMIKNKLIADEIPFRICGEVAFGSAEVAIVIFPMTKERTPKYLRFLKMFK